MVEYVLGGSPTNKESPLALEPRLRGLKIDEVKVSYIYYVDIKASSSLDHSLISLLNSRTTMIKKTHHHHLKRMV